MEKTGTKEIIQGQKRKGRGPALTTVGGAATYGRGWLLGPPRFFRSIFTRAQKLRPRLYGLRARARAASCFYSVVNRHEAVLRLPFSNENCRKKKKWARDLHCPQYARRRPLEPALAPEREREREGEKNLPGVLLHVATAPHKPLLFVAHSLISGGGA
jgi:hypothetical protein